MQPLNYHHLHYFWMVVREGSVLAASRRLHVGAPAISMQLKALERSLGRELLVRRGRRLVPTRAGELAFEHAERIFRTGDELVAALADERASRPRLRVGVADVLSKTLVATLLAPLLAPGEDDDAAPTPPGLDCSEGAPDELFAALALRRLDLVLSDVPPRASTGPTLHARLLGAADAHLFGAPDVVARLSGPFPGCLNGAPLLLPARASALRRGLDAWLAEAGLRPRVLGEFADSALLKTFGREGAGLFAAAVVDAGVVERHWNVRRVGPVEDASEEVFAVTAERTPRDPRIPLVLEHARAALGRRPGAREGVGD